MGSLKTLGTIAALVALVALPAGAATSAPLKAAANQVTFEDSTGETGGESPDITSAVVSNTNAGLITFKINIPNRATFSEDILVNVDIDSDNNPATGDPETLGADYAIQLFRGSADLFRWDGTSFTRTATDPPQSSLVFSYAGGPSIKISAAELGNTTQLNFGALVITGIKLDLNGDPDFTAARADIAPDAGHGLWKYEVKTAPLRLVARKFTAGTPRAGAVYTAKLSAARNDTGAVLASGKVTCKASVGGRPLRARTQRFVNREAVCSWLIPGTARGQKLRGSVAVAFEGKTLVKAFSKSIG
jgi:hypothetical protein